MFVHACNKNIIPVIKCIYLYYALTLQAARAT